MNFDGCSNLIGTTFHCFISILSYLSALSLSLSFQRAVVSIDRKAEQDINQILSNVRRQSDTEQAANYFSGHHRPGHSHSRADHSHPQASNSHPEDAWSSLEPVERTSQASLSGETSGESSEASGWYFDTEGMACEEVGVAQDSGTAPPPGFSTRHTGTPSSAEGTDGTRTQASLGGGVSEEAIPMSCEAGGMDRMKELDAKLRDELLEAQSQNKKYKKMLVSSSNNGWSLYNELSNQNHSKCLVYSFLE